MNCHIDRVGVAATLLMPLFLLHGRGIADTLMVVVGAAFLLRAALNRDWAWTGASWWRIGLAWWAWLVFCSLPFWAVDGWRATIQALASIRFLVFVAALENHVLRSVRVRRWLQVVLSASALYIALQSLLQFATGHNLFGNPRSGDGELTGPFDKPRAAPPYSRLLFPTLLPAVAAAFERGRAGRIFGVALALFGVGMLVLIGQRMPLLLGGLGLLISGLLLKRLRMLVIVVCVAGMALVAATPVVSPPTFYRLVTKFSRQMSDFPDTQYGQLAARALSFVQAHPVRGGGFDAFRVACPDPAYFHGWHDRSQEGGPADTGGGAAICAQHPHNHYLQALVESGVPGLLLFSALVLAWLVALGRGLWRIELPLRVGLFVAALIQEWPIASTSDLLAMPLTGWFVLLLGFGLAEAAQAGAVAEPGAAPYMPASDG